MPPADAGFPASAPHAAGSSGALAGGSAQNQRAPAVPGRRADRTPQHAAGSADAGFPASVPPAAGSSGALAGGSAQNQRAPAVPDRRADRTPQHAAGSADAGFPASAPHATGPSGALAAGRRRTSERQRYPGSGDRTPQDAAGSADAGVPASAPHAAGPSGVLTGGSAQSQRARAVPDRRADRTPQRAGGSAQNQLAPRVGSVRSRTDTEAHRGGRARLPEGGTAARPPAPESSRARRARRHIPAAVRRAVWRRDGGACCYRGPAHRRDLWLYPLGADRPHRAGGAGRQRRHCQLASPLRGP